MRERWVLHGSALYVLPVAIAVGCGSDAAAPAPAREALVGSTTTAVADDGLLAAVDRRLEALDARHDLSPAERLRARYELFEELMRERGDAEDSTEEVRARMEDAAALRRYITDESLSAEDVEAVEASIRAGLALEPVTEDDILASEMTYDAIRAMGVATDAENAGRAER